MRTVEIHTCNSVYENGEVVGGYHENHRITYLQNANHVIATIDSIVKNNLLHGCNDTVLEDVIVSCNHHGTVEELREHYSNGFVGKVKISIDYIFNL